MRTRPRRWSRSCAAWPLSGLRTPASLTAAGCAARPPHSRTSNCSGCRMRSVTPCMTTCWVLWVLVSSCIVCTSLPLVQRLSRLLKTSYRLMRAYQKDAEQHGAIVMLNTCLEGGDVSGAGHGAGHLRHAPSAAHARTLAPACDTALDVHALLQQGLAGLTTACLPCT